MKKLLVFFSLCTILWACNHENTVKPIDSRITSRADAMENPNSFPVDYQHKESPDVRKLVNFILTMENSDKFASQKFFDSSKSVEVVSIIGQNVYTLYFSDANYLSISVRPYRKKFSAIERFSCADEWLDGEADFGFIGDSTTSKKDSKYFAQTNMFAASDETMVLENHDYWQKVYSASLRKIIAYYKL